MTHSEYEAEIENRRQKIDALFFVNKIDEERMNWLKRHISNICCEYAEPFPGGCVGIFCCKCSVHSQTHIGGHE